MLRLSGIYHNRDILSLRTGRPVGHAYSPVINPNNLKIEGWYATARGEKDSLVLPAGQIRDVIAKGLVVDDHDAITHPDDLVRMKNILDINYELIGKPVVTESKRRLGKIQDYSVDDDSMYVQKLYITQSLLRGINKKQLIIDRDQVIEITDKKIIVNDLKEKATSGEQTSVVPAG